MNPNNLKVTMDANASTHTMEYHRDMDDESKDDTDNDPDIPSLLPRFDSDSKDDDSSEDDDSGVSVLTQPPLVVPKRGKDKAHQNKAAPNRLVNVIALKKVIETNLITCPVCKSKDRRICDGISKGLAIKLVVRCRGCDKIKHAYKNKVHFLYDKLKHPN